MKVEDIKVVVEATRAGGAIRVGVGAKVVAMVGVEEKVGVAGAAEEEKAGREDTDRAIAQIHTRTSTLSKTQMQSLLIEKVGEGEEVVDVDSLGESTLVSNTTVT